MLYSNTHPMSSQISAPSYAPIETSKFPPSPQLAPLFYVEHFSNCSIAEFAEGFLVFFWPLTKYPLIFFKESDEVVFSFFFTQKTFFLFPLDRDSR